MALIYQKSVETGADSGAKVAVHQRPRVIHEKCVSRQTRRTNGRALINVADENNRNLNITPLYTHDLEAAPTSVTTFRHGIR